MSFYRETLVKKTKKKHPCGFCGRMIPEGKPAMQTAGTSEGDFFSGYLCLPCRRDMNEVELEDGYSPGDYYEYDEISEKCPECGENCMGTLCKEDTAYLEYTCDCGHEFKVFRGWE